MLRQLSVQGRSAGKPQNPDLEIGRVGRSENQEDYFDGLSVTTSAMPPLVKPRTTTEQRFPLWRALRKRSAFVEERRSFIFSLQYSL